MPKAFPDQFNQRCIDSVHVLGKTHAKAAAEYEVSPPALGRWMPIPGRTNPPRQLKLLLGADGVFGLVSPGGKR